METITRKQVIEVFRYLDDFLDMMCDIDAMKEACKQAIELAVENAKINCKLDIQEGKWVREIFSLYKQDYNDFTSCTVTTNKQSILDTINQIE